MKKSILQAALCLPLLFSGFVAEAQQRPHVCGSTIAEQQAGLDRMFENRRNRTALLSRLGDYRNNDSTIYIPIQFHLVGNSAGQGYLSVENLWANMCRLNEDYADQNIQFYLFASPRYIANTSLYNNDEDDRSLASYLMALYRVEGCLNIFIGNVIGDITGQGGVTLGYYTPYPDVMYAIKSTVNGTSKTLTHEIGHFFTLAHPFFGWDGVDYATTIAGNGNKPPVTMGGQLTEKVARSGGTENCQIAADGFCDTKPDYNFGLFAPGCVIPFAAVDPDSVRLDAASAADNYMSYFNDNCTNGFSPQQKEAIILDVVSRGFDRLPAPSLAAVTAAPNIVWPTSTAPSPYATLELVWDAVPNATQYTVTVDRTLNGNFVSRIGQWVTPYTTQWLDLEPNREYTWTVRANNSIDFCPNLSSAPMQFRTFDWAVGVDQLANTGITSSKVYPNPASRQGSVSIEMNVAQNTQATISISNSIGQTLMNRQTVQLVQGTNIETLDLSMLAAGLYFVNIETTQGRTTHKLRVD
jgi:hypothetical protein